MRAFVSILCASLLVYGSALAGPASADSAGPRTDLDGDGRNDVVIGAAGVLALVDGDGTKHVVPAPKSDPINTLFGSFTATGDFNGDGFDDVAAGDPFYGSSGGVVWILSGGPHGTLIGDGTIPAVMIQPGLEGLPGIAQRGDYFGGSLAAGDLTGDGVDDLVIGAMFQKAGSAQNAGSVTLIPGGAGGLPPADGRVFTQATPGIPGTFGYNDKFGSAVAIGDVTGDGRLDLAIGADGEDNRGRVYLLPGAAGGPTGRGATSVTAEALGIKAPSTSAADFGASLAIGDLTGDGRADVVAGAPYAQVGKPQCGSVAVLRGSPAGIRAAAAQVVSQSSAGVVGICEEGDAWGAGLAIGNLTGDKHPELVVGAPVESVGALNGGGAYTVLRPSKSGVTGAGSFGVTQNSAHVPGTAEIGDDFGQSLMLTDVNRDGRLDVLTSADGEKIGSRASGAVAVLISTANGKPGASSTELTGRSFTPAVSRLGRSLAGPAAQP